jgi:hypothetical protein
MPNLNVDMKSIADFAVKSARDRYQLELDYSDQSIAGLENIVTRIYWGFSNRDKDAKDGLIYNTALIWGSYLGEFMRQKWGGTWVLKGSDPLISIKNIEFSPIALIYQKITNHPEYSLENFVIEAGKRIPPRVAAPQASQYPPSDIRHPKKLISSKKIEQPRKIDKRFLIALAGIGGILLVALTFIFGYRMIRAGGISVSGLRATVSRTNPALLLVKTTETPTPSATNTPFFTPTLLPTYTPKPTSTPIPSHTPLPTDTPTASVTPTETPTPTRTRIPPRPPTDTSPPPIIAPPTPTQPPPATQPPPVVIVSCGIDPSTVPVGNSVTITFIVNFSAPGYGFDTSFDSGYPGQSGCSGTDGDGDGRAFCDGSSGVLTGSTTVNVTFKSSVGDCIASYSSP